MKSKWGAREANERLHSDRVFLSAALDNSSDLFVVIDEGANLLYVNTASERILGRRVVDLIGQNIVEFVHPDDVGAAVRVLSEIMDGEGGEPARQILRVCHSDGSWRHLETLSNNLVDDPSVGRILINARDVSQRIWNSARDGAAQRSFQQAFQRSPIGMALTTLEGNYVRVNEAMCSLLGRTHEAMLMTSVLDTTHPDDLRATVDAAVELLDGNTVSFSFEKRFLEAGGEPVWTRATTTLLRDDDDQPLHFLTQVEDIGERRQLIEQLRMSALRDPLTGLANRAGLDEYLGALPPTMTIGVMALDLDRFKHVNDTSGHAVGDEVLRVVSQRIRSSARPRDHTARTGGDEFVVVCQQPRSDREFTNLARRFLCRIREPIHIGDAMFSVGASVGVAIGPAFDAPAMMVRADQASYDAKRSGGDVVSSLDRC